jgi:protein FAM50
LTPNSNLPSAKKKKKKARKIISYEDAEDQEDTSRPQVKKAPSKSIENETVPALRKARPNPNSLLPAPKAMTKAALAADSLERERLRKEFLEVQEKVKNTEIAIPFVFYDGANIPGDTVKIKKGDHIWLFLERARKVGAEKGVQGSGAAAGGLNSHDSKKQWARVGVDDLMCVRGGVIIPHHYELYYFIANKTPDPAREGRCLFEYKGTADASQVEEVPLLRIPGQEKLEGRDDDPIYTKVVDRRWYQKNKHIFPASTWKEFKLGREFEDSAKQRKDAEGNAFFFA